MKLSIYIAQAGVCSRRKAAELVKQGGVTVDGKSIHEPWYEVKAGQSVEVQGKLIELQKKIYILLNKPKDFLSTVADERGRKSVLDLIRPEISERLYPIGRLDRNTTGLLVLTNDGDLTQKLAHPRYEVKKIYHVIVDKPLHERDVQKIMQGVELEDGVVSVDALQFVPGEPKTNLTIKIHSGKYRVIRRLFAYLGYEIIKLDRINYAGLTKKGLSVGSWRYLTDKEVASLKKYGSVE